jgi:hypothetical protein
VDELGMGCAMNDENYGISLLDDVDYWRSRAKETREIAHTMDGELRAAMVDFAIQYDQLAELPEKRLKERSSEQSTADTEPDTVMTGNVP